MTTKTTALGILAGGALGQSVALLSDRDSWYSEVASAVGVEAPITVPRNAEDAFKRIVQRSRLDDRFSSIEWQDPADGLDIDAHDHELRPGLWLTNMGGTGNTRESFRARARRIFPESEFGPMETRPYGNDEIDSFGQAITLLESHFDPVWSQCASTIGLIALHRSSAVSMQSSYTPETVYVGDAILQAPIWKLADGILHESLHERTLLMRQLWPLLRPGYAEATAPSVHLPWSGGEVPDRHFTPWRLISAAHVYTHLAVFRSEVGQFEDVHLPAVRGRFMIDALQRAHFAAELGPEGGALRDMLSAALAEVE